MIVGVRLTNFTCAALYTVELASSEASAQSEVLLPDGDLYNDVELVTQHKPSEELHKRSIRCPRHQQNRHRHSIRCEKGFSSNIL